MGKSMTHTPKAGDELGVVVPIRPEVDVQDAAIKSEIHQAALEAAQQACAEHGLQPGEITYNRTSTSTSLTPITIGGIKLGEGWKLARYSVVAQ